MKSSKPNKKVKVAFVLPSLSPGGAERVMSFVAQNINKEEFSVSLWITGIPSEKDYTVSEVDCTYFGKSRVLKSAGPLIKRLRKDKPDVVISSIAHLNKLVGLVSHLFPKIKFVGREANVLSVLRQFSTKKPSKVNSKIFRFSYLSLDRILCTSKDMIEDFENVYKFPSTKLELINNPITSTFKHKKTSPSNNGTIQFVTVGSMKKQKGHERILKALAKLDLDYTYTMIGDGAERERILELCKDLGIHEKVNHIPFTKEVNEHLVQSDVFLQGAYVEGFPNCLLESATVGLPIVAFNAVGGLNEIVQEGFNGYVAYEESQYPSLIKKAALETKWDYVAITTNSMEKYGTQKIIGQYEALFKRLLSQ